MTPAEQEEVRDRRDPAVRPMLDMMGVAPTLWPVASREPAVTIAHHDGAPDGERDDRRSAADVERFGPR
jgi:hypothetical protein